MIILSLEDVRKLLMDADIPLATNGILLVDHVFTVYVLLNGTDPHAVRLALGKVFAKLRRETGITVSWRSKGTTSNEAYFSFVLEGV